MVSSIIKEQAIDLWFKMCDYKLRSYETVKHSGEVRFTIILPYGLREINLHLVEFNKEHSKEKVLASPFTDGFIQLTEEEYNLLYNKFLESKDRTVTYLDIISLLDEN